MIANTDASSRCSYLTTFRRFGGSASEEATRVRKKYLQNFENVGSVARHLEAIRRGGVVSK